MLENLDLTEGLIYSQPVLLALVDTGMDRQEAYKVVQAHAHHALSGGPRLQDGLASDPTVAERLGAAELASLFDPMGQLQHIDEIFVRLGLGEGSLETAAVQ
jgi:adenylosuccinate lyase